MPVFTIETPTGRKLDIEAADQNEAIRGAQEWETQNPQKSTGFGDALKQGAANVVGGLGETLKQYGPEAAQGVAESLKAGGAAVAPKNYEPATVIGDGGKLSNLPRAVTESAPSLAASVGVGRYMPGPFWLKALAGAAAGTATQLGTSAKQRAQYNTGDENAEPTTSDKTAAAASAIPETVAGAIGVGRFLKGGAGAVKNVGSRGVYESGKKLATTAAIEGAVEGGQNAINQVGRTAGTAPGLSVDPAEAANSAVVGAATGGAFASPTAARDAGGSIKYRNVDTESATRVANRLKQTGNDVSRPDAGHVAVTQVDSDLRQEIAAAVKDVKDTAAHSQESRNALARARSGNLEERDLSAVDAAVRGLPEADAVSQLVRDAKTLRQLKEMGDFSNGKFKGGISGTLEKHVRALQNPVGAAAAAGLTAAGVGGANMAAMFTAAPAALGVIGAGYGGARMVDKFTGNRSPANRFVKRFSDDSTSVRPQVQQPPVPPPGPNPNMGPWGPYPNAGPTGPRVAGPAASPRPQVPNMHALVAKLNQQGGPGFGLAKPPEGFGTNLLAQARVVNKLSKQRDADEKAQNKKTVDDAMPLVRALSAISKRKPWQSPGGEDVILSRAPEAQRALPAPDGVIYAGAPEPQKLLTGPKTIYAGPPEEQKRIAPPTPARNRERAQEALGDTKAFGDYLARLVSTAEPEGPKQPDTPAELARMLSVAKATRKNPVAEAREVRAENKPAITAKPAENVETLDYKSAGATYKNADGTRKKPAEIKWDRNTTGEGARPLTEQTVVEVDPVALDKAFKATDPGMYDTIPGRMERLKEHVENGKPVSVPEVGVTDGRLGFTNGRTRARLAAERGDARIPVAVDKGNEQEVTALVSSYADRPQGASVAENERLDYSSAGATRKKPKTIVPAPKAALSEAFEAAPKPALSKAAIEMEDIPEFLRRTKDKPVEKAPALQEAFAAKKATEKPAASDDGPGLSPHYAKGNVEETIQSAIDDFVTKYAHRMAPEAVEKSKETIRRIFKEKYATARAVNKAVPGLDVDDFTSRYIHTRSFDGGAVLRDYMKSKYPEHADAFDTHMSEKAFSTIYTNKSTHKDGTRAKRKK